MPTVLDLFNLMQIPDINSRVSEIFARIQEQRKVRNSRLRAEATKFLNAPRRKVDITKQFESLQEKIASLPGLPEQASTTAVENRFRGLNQLSTPDHTQITTRPVSNFLTDLDSRVNRLSDVLGNLVGATPSAPSGDTNTILPVKQPATQESTTNLQRFTSSGTFNPDQQEELDKAVSNLTSEQLQTNTASFRTAIENIGKLKG